jgi:Sulfotransferase family
VALRALRYLFSAEAGGRPSLRTIAVRVERLRRRDRWRYSPRRRLRSVDRIELDRPIFMLGLQGGGTTLVTRCLLRHPCAVSASGDCSYWVATNELGFIRNRMAVLPASLWGSSHRADLNHPVFGTEHASVWACDELLPAYRRGAGEATAADSERFKRVLREHIAVYARDEHAARFVDKTHTNTVKIPYIEALLDGCDPLYVLVVRDPYALCPVAIRRKPPSWRTVPPFEQQVAVAAEHWHNAMRLALDDGERTGRFLAVRFEDFLRDPETVVRAIGAKVGLAYQPALVPRRGDRLPFATLPTDTKWYPLRTASPHARPTPEAIEIIDARCGVLARRLGYRPDGEPAPPEPGLVSAT